MILTTKSLVEIGVGQPQSVKGVLTFEITYDQKEHIIDEMNDRFRSGERIESGVDQVLSL